MADEDTPMNIGNDNKFDDLETFKQRWSTRRKMAWVALVAMIIVTLAVMFGLPKETIEEIRSMIEWFYMTMASVVLGYMGLTTVAFLKR